VKSIEDAGC